MSERRPEALMRRAIELSRNGFPAPNPRVGCVIAKDGRTVGEGHHDHAGGPHAEVVALEQAGEEARGADVFVTLEPCNHHGRTGPCSEALIAAGVASVTYALSDPDPIAKGGDEKLRAAGIQVHQGLLRDEAASVNPVFLESFRLGQPYVCIKVAMSLDGKTALCNGESKWITGPEARADGHRLRAEMGAVLIGSGTVLADDPQLTARIEGVVNQPVAVVLDPEAVTPPTARLYTGACAVLRFVASGRASREGDIELPLEGGEFDLTNVLQNLWNRNVRGVLVEGGGVTIGAFLKRRLFGRLELFVAPKIIGKGLGWTGDLSFGSLREALDLRALEIVQLGEDIRISCEPSRT